MRAWWLRGELAPAGRQVTVPSWVVLTAPQMPQALRTCYILPTWRVDLGKHLQILQTDSRLLGWELQGSLGYGPERESMSVVACHVDKIEAIRKTDSGVVC